MISFFRHAEVMTLKSPFPQIGEMNRILDSEEVVMEGIGCGKEGEMWCQVLESGEVLSR